MCYGLCVFSFIILTTLENRKIFLVLLQNTISKNGSISKIARTPITITLYCFIFFIALFLGFFFLSFYATPSPSLGPEPVAVTEKGLKVLANVTLLVSEADGKRQESRSRDCFPLNKADTVPAQ